MGESSDSFYALAVKRWLDLLGSVALLLLTAPLQIIAAVAIVIEDGPPVYYNHERAGYKGRTFRLHKLRTMRTGTEEKFGSFPTADAVTSVGALLRRYSIDELPQLLNIARGEMSFVGPRPPLVSHISRYTETQLTRLSVRPGLTGLAQVRYRNLAPWSIRIRSDLEYIGRMSIALDFKILLRTAVNVMTGKDQIVGQGSADVDDLAAPASLAAGSGAIAEEGTAGRDATDLDPDDQSPGHAEVRGRK